MTREEHIARHKELHAALDELLADWISNSPSWPAETRLPSKRTILELMQWSHQQCQEPTLPCGGKHEELPLEESKE